MNSLPSIGIIREILILRHLKGQGLLIAGLHYEDVREPALLSRLTANKVSCPTRSVCYERTSAVHKGRGTSADST